MAICSDSDDEFSSALDLVRIIYTDQGVYSDRKLERNDRVMIVLLLLRDAAR